MLIIHVPHVLLDYSLLLARLIVGLSFLVSAKNKVKNFKKFSKSNDIPMPLSVFLATAELCGALGMMSGVLGQLAAMGLMLIMLSTMSLHIFKWKSPYWAASGGWEYDLMLFTLCSAIAINGPGRWVIF